MSHIWKPSSTPRAGRHPCRRAHPERAVRAYCVLLFVTLARIGLVATITAAFVAHRDAGVSLHVAPDGLVLRGGICGLAVTTAIAIAAFRVATAPTRGRACPRAGRGDTSHELQHGRDKTLEIPQVVPERAVDQPQVNFHVIVHA